MSKIEDCALKPVGELPFILEKGACQARLDDKVMLCFSGHESSDDYRDGYQSCKYQVLGLESGFESGLELWTKT